MRLTDVRSRLDHDGLVGPLALSPASADLLNPLITAAAQEENPRNLHARCDLATRVIHDAAIKTCVLDLFGSGYRLWRTNFFRREAGTRHPGVQLHHDKHFQSGSAAIDFQELGEHLSIVIALDTIDARNGCFRYLLGSHCGSLPGVARDTRPFEQRPLSDHFLSLPPELEAQVEEILLPAGSYCLFHSALLHGSSPSEGLLGRTSMVARLVSNRCVIPPDCASADDIVPFC